jgi:hypothetical protein
MSRGLKFLLGGGQRGQVAVAWWLEGQARGFLDGHCVEGGAHLAGLGGKAARNRQTGGLPHNALSAAEARRRANEFYQRLMRDTFKECRRILRDEGGLTVMFTHKKQEAWEALFTSLVQAGFTITATWQRSKAGKAARPWRG